MAAATSPSPRVTGGTRPQRSALAEALARLHSHGTRVEIAPGPRAGYTGHRTTLTFIGPSDPESQWKDEVAVGVYLARGFPARWVVIPGTGAGHYSLWHGMEATGKAQFLRTLRRAARESHAQVERVEFLNPRALAVVVTITALRPIVFEREGLPLGSLLDGSHPRLEGIFLIVRGPRGHVMTRGGTAFRVGAGAGRWPGSGHGGGSVPIPYVWRNESMSRSTAATARPRTRMPSSRLGPAIPAPVTFALPM